MFADNVQEYHVLDSASVILYVTKNNQKYDVNFLHTKTKNHYTVCSSTEKPVCVPCDMQNKHVFTHSGVCYSDDMIMFVVRNELDSALMVCRYNNVDRRFHIEPFTMRGKISNTIARIDNDVVILTLENTGLNVHNDAVETNIRNSTLILYDIKKRQEIRRFETSIFKLIDDKYIMLINLHFYVLYKIGSLASNTSLLQVSSCFDKINEYYRKHPYTLGTSARIFCHKVVNCVVLENFIIVTLPSCDGDKLDATTTIYEISCR